MEGAASLKVPLTVDVGIGDNWKEAKHAAPDPPEDVPPAE
jgi:hypothetical protein